MIILVLFLTLLCAHPDVSAQAPDRGSTVFNTDLTTILLNNNEITHENSTYIQRIDACFELNRPLIEPSRGRVYFAMGATDHEFTALTNIRNYVTRCMRGTPYNEFMLHNPSATTADYLQSSLDETEELIAHYKRQLFELKGDATEGSPMPVISRIDNGDLQPYYLRGRGNFWFTTIHQLEHHVEQILHLVHKELLPIEFLQYGMNIRYKIVPAIAQALAKDCVYFGKKDRSEGCPDDIRISYYMLDDWMIREMYGLHNKLVYSAVEAPAVFGSALAVNPELDFEGIQDAYFRGDVLQIDNLLTPAALYNIRKVALESTTFFDSKVGYLGSYMDDGLQSVWIMKLARELQELMPRVLKDQALRQAWFYKYDSGSEDENYSRGIKVHADLARVNLNIWLTPDEANLDPISGGLLIYDTLPGSDEFEASNFADWNNWENVNDMMTYLKESDAKVTKVTNKQNRCAMFNSALLHETDQFKFKEGYENRRINLTLLFGLDTQVEEKPTGVLTKFE